MSSKKPKVNIPIQVLNKTSKDVRIAILPRANSRVSQETRRRPFGEP
jgi:hypothetical protein